MKYSIQKPMTRERLTRKTETRKARKPMHSTASGTFSTPGVLILCDDPKSMELDKKALSLSNVL